MMRRRSLALGALAATVLSFPVRAREPLVVGQTFLSAGLDPARGSAGWALVSHGVAEKLFTMNQNGRLEPQLADSVARIDDRTWTVMLKAGRLFSDGTPVTARAVAEALSRTVSENAAARASAGSIAFETDGDLALRLRSERAIPSAAVLLAEWVFAVYRRDGDAMHFTGPWAVAAFEADRRLRLAPNPHHPASADLPPIEIRRFPDAQAMALAAQAGEIDLAFNVPAETVPRLQRSDGLTVKSFPVSYQYMAWLNTTRPALGDVRVRRAIDLAIDRSELVRALTGGLPATGAYAPEFPFAGKAPRPFDPANAAALLEQAGWRLDGGLRRNAGVPLRLEVVAYPQRPDLVTLLPVLRARLAALGVEVVTRVTENVSVTAKEGSFDVLLWAQHTAPAADPAFFPNLFLRSGAANNHARFTDSALDALLDEFARESDPDRRAEIAARAERRVFEMAPVAYLLTPVWHVALSRRVAGYTPWGSDYHIVRPDLRPAR